MGDMKDFDDLTSFLGSYGFFQVLVMLLLSATAVVSGYSIMLSVFVSDTPDHRCRLSMENSTLNGTDVTDVHVSFSEQSRWIGPDSCSRYSGNGNWTAGSVNGTERCPDGWVFSTERYTSTIVSEWGLVCDHAWKVPFSTSLFFFGIMIGSLCCGQLSDRLSDELEVCSGCILPSTLRYLERLQVPTVI